MTAASHQHFINWLPSSSPRVYSYSPADKGWTLRFQENYKYADNKHLSSTVQLMGRV